MATEGIMSLPAGLGMQGELDAQPAVPTVTSADSYDAASIALGNLDPQAQAAAKQAIREAIGELQLTPEQLDLMIQVFEYVSNNPAEYENLVQTLVQEGIADPGDFPEQYDPQFIGMLLMVLNEMRMMQSQGAMEPMQAGPAMEGLEPMAMAEGGLADVAAYLASQGRNGDTMLAHITPEEAALLKRRGGSGTINPVTGLPEFFIKKVFKAVKSVVKGVVNVVKKAMQSPVGRILGTIALATVLGPAGVGLSMGTAAGLASAGTTLLGGGSVKDALISGAMGYFGGGGTAFGVNPVASIGQYLPGAAGSALNTGLTTGLIGAGVGKLSGMSTADALKMGLTSGATAAALTGLKGTGFDQTPEQRAARDAAFRDAQAAAGGPGGVAPGGVGTAQNMLASGGTFTPGPGMDAASLAEYYRQIGINPASISPTLPGTTPTNLQIEQGILGLPGTPAAAAVPPPAIAPAATAAAAPTGGTFTPGPGMDAASMANYYRQIGINPESVSSALPGTSPTNIQIERSALGMTGPADTARQFLREPLNVAKDFYNTNLSPSRPGLPADAGIFTKYGPLVAAGTAATGLLGGFKGAPADPNPLFQRTYTGVDYLRDNPNRFQGGLDFSYSTPTTPANPVVQTNFAQPIPLGQPTQVVPMGATMSPGGVAQPYNVSGLYGIPLVYPVNRAKGGEMSMTEFPRKTGPINGPGTGTSDSIPAMLSDGEFVFTAKAVRSAGGGSRRKGAARMYKLMKKLEGGAVKGQ
jgi:hypothetical protein